MKTKKWLILFSLSIDCGRIVGMREVHITYNNKKKYLSASDIKDARETEKEIVCRENMISITQVSLCVQNIIPLNDKGD
jgi:hypothetical protein